MSASFVVNTQCAVVRNGRYLMIVRGEREMHAPGERGFPGGKVEVADGPDRILESAVRREVLEETGITVSSELRYIRSVAFTMTNGTAVVDVLFLGEHLTGEPHIAAPDEVAEIRWMTAGDILSDERTPPWLRHSIGQVETVRLSHV